MLSLIPSASGGGRTKPPPASWMTSWRRAAGGGAAADAGADAVGLIFAESRRRVTVAQAARIVAVLPPFVSAVGVFVDAPADEVLSLAHGVPLDAVQLHGEEPPEMIEILRAQGVRVLKAVKDLDH